ncbi:MAG TPA: DNA repair protein RadC [Polyangiaceae bacterium]|nr:DNA repair protein RadC [Polyangiaceae bacterium]
MRTETAARLLLPPSSRPRQPLSGPTARERAQRDGIAALSDTELLALLLATGVAGQPVAALAHDLLSRVGGVERLERVGPYRLSEQRGIGLVKATRLLAAIELGRRVTLKSLCDDTVVFGSFDAVAAWARPRLAALDHEEVWLLCLDAKHGLRSARRIARGGLHGCALRPADVLRPALEDAASGIVIVHNHPSGDPTPSSADIEMTRSLIDACQILGLHLLDHVIVARSGAQSLRELTLFDD